MTWLLLSILIFAVLPLLAGQHMRDKYEQKWKQRKGSPGLPTWES
jgi:ACR3 family arsenite efflux pump ArsB